MGLHSATVTFSGLSGDASPLRAPRIKLEVATVHGRVRSQDPIGEALRPLFGAQFGIRRPAIRAEASGMDGTNGYAVVRELLREVESEHGDVRIHA